MEGGERERERERERGGERGGCHFKWQPRRLPALAGFQTQHTLGSVNYFPLLVALSAFPTRPVQASWHAPCVADSRCSVAREPGPLQVGSDLNRLVVRTTHKALTLSEENS